VQVGIGLAALLAVTLLVVLQWRRRYLAVGWFWFLGTLVPMIGIVQVGAQAMANRYAYLPVVGLFLMLSWGVADLGDWVAGSRPESRRRATAALAGVSIAALLALSVAARVQLDYWRNNSVIWSHDLEVTQGNWIAEDLVGAALIKDGKLEAAMPHYYRAIAIRPDDIPSNLNIGAYQQRMGNMPEAIEHLKKVISLKGATPSQLTKAYTNLGYAERSLGNYAESRKYLEIAVQMKPTDAEAWTFLGTDAHRMGDFDAAAHAYSKAIEINPLSWRYLLLSQALEQGGHHEQSQKALDKAKMIALDFKETQKLASNVLGSEHN
jgi:tetratricopeptide (TPR) repeat protein